MDLENQKRVKDLAEKYGCENIVVLLGGAEAESSGLACETVTNGDPTFAGPLAGVSLGLLCYHVVEPEIKNQIVKGSFVPNSPATIIRKGSTRPLVDTGNLLQSVHFSVITKTGEKIVS